MSELAHVATMMDRTSEALNAWARGLLKEAEVDLTVTAEPTDEPGLLLLPYQTIMESQSTVPASPLVPVSATGVPVGVTEGWQRAARAMTAFLLEHYPKRATKAPGLGPLDPRPELKQLPKPLASWYRAQDDAWRPTKDRGLLPSVAWRQGYSFVVRYAGIAPRAGGARLKALAVLAAGVRQRRYFEVEMQPPPADSALLGLLDAMQNSEEGEAADELADVAAAVRRERTVAVGVYPHHDLTDADLAWLLRTLELPMQPALVFALRLSLGAGPVLETGALPSVPPIEMGKRS